MIKLIINTIKLLVKKKSYILMGVIMPAFIIVFFSFEFGSEYKFRVGIVDNDNSYASEEIKKVINNLEDIESIEIEEKDYKMLLISQQIQMAIFIDKDFQYKLLNSEDEEIIMKSINENDVNSVVKTMIQLKCEDLSMIGKLSNKDINKFKEINENYNDQSTKLSLNDIKESSPQIERTLGLIIFLIFITCGNISSFLIENEENKTKIRIISSGISQCKYYICLVFVFYIMSSITTIIYYILCKVFRIDFGLENSINFLIIMLFLNLIALSFNLCIVAFTRSRYTSTIANILIVVPSCMLSGVFWDFNIMSENLKSIGRCIPTRWVIASIECLQKTNDLRSIKIYLFAITIFSMILFVISFLKLRSISLKKNINIIKSKGWTK